MSSELIGKVKLIYDFFSGDDKYSDGNIEDTLLEIVKNNDVYTEILNQTDNWALLYHLSSERGNITSVMNIDKTCDVLEIGAGCGAVTGFLAQKAKSIDCIELSKKRSLINAYKNKYHDNVNIYVGNFETINTGKKYDVITLIGVLEYSALYISTPTPFADMIKKVKSLLKPSGKLYIAIENKYGLKYFAGCSEDHTGMMFDGIEGYKNSESKVRTFSHSELRSLIASNGFREEDIIFFYPYPDYKMPREIFSDKFLPKVGELCDNISNYDQRRKILFDERLAFDSMSYGDEFKIFSNSFLVEAVRLEEVVDESNL